MFRATNRSVSGAVLGLAVVVAFGCGLVTGIVGVRSDTSAQGGAITAAAAEITRSAAHPVSRDKLEQAAIAGMLSVLEDPWSRYYAPSDYRSYRAALAGQYSGVGVWLDQRQRGQVVVTGVQPGSPASTAGVQQGDRLVRVAGRTVGAAVRDAVDRLRGPSGTEVAVTVARDGELRRLVLARRAIQTSAVTMKHLRGGVLLVDVAEFTRGVGRQVREAVMAKSPAPGGGVILDLRGNPGGLLSEAVETASVFLDGGTVVSYERRGHGRRVLRAVGEGDTATPLVVLVDGGSASAAEVVAGALQDRNRAVIVGTRTVGKGMVQQAYPLNDGSALKLTVGRYYTPDGRSIGRRGITPDVYVAPGRPAEVAEHRALEVLSGLLAAAPHETRDGKRRG